MFIKKYFVLLLYRYMKALLNDEYLIGTNRIDREHQKIIASINNLGELVGQDKPDFRKVKRAIIVLGSYIRAHISCEEDWMSRNIEKLNQQVRDVNSKFFVIYQGLKDRIEKDSNYVALLEVLYEYTKSWFTEHINATQEIIYKTVEDKASISKHLTSMPQMPMQSCFA